MESWSTTDVSAFLYCSQSNCYFNRYLQTYTRLFKIFLVIYLVSIVKHNVNNMHLRKQEQEAEAKARALLEEEASGARVTGPSGEGEAGEG